MKKKRIVIYDCDILIYRVAAACEERSITALHKKSNKSKVFKNRTEMKDFLSAKDYVYTLDDFEITDNQEINDSMNYRFILDNQIKTIYENLWQDETLFYVAGKGNFRDSLLLPTKYKGGRSSVMTPLLRNDCKDYLIRKHGAKVVNGHEVDDEIIIQGYKYLEKGYDTILVTVDKDSWASSGLRLYNYTVDNPVIEDIPALGALYRNEKGEVKGNGFLWGCFQHVYGDKTDSLCPYELAGTKFGQVAAYNLLKSCLTEQEALQACIRQFQTWYPKRFKYTAWNGVECDVTWKDMIDLYFKGIRMKQTHDDQLIFKDFALKYKIDLDNYVEEMQD